MSATTHAMHCDHLAWASEISLWRDDLRVWQQELSKAQAELIELEKPLQNHAQTLRVHASSIRLYEQEFRGHEHLLAEFEKQPSGNENRWNLLARDHSRETDQQAQQRKAHEQLKQHHHTVMLHWKRLLKTLRQPVDASEDTSPDLRR